MQTTDEEIKKEFYEKFGDRFSLPNLVKLLDWFLDKQHTLQEEYKKELIEKIENYAPKKEVFYGVEKVQVTLDDHKRNFAREIINIINS